MEWPDEAALLHTDEDVLVVKIEADDPRTVPTQVLTLVSPAGGTTIAELDAAPAAMAAFYGWGLGYTVEVSRRGGGIGAEGASVLEMVLGVVTIVPTLLDLYDRFSDSKPACPERTDAIHQATWAVARAYTHVDREALNCVSEAPSGDHWTFQFTLAGTNDRFEVEVYGSPTTTVATRVAWMNGNAWGDRAPGQH